MSGLDHALSNAARWVAAWWLERAAGPTNREIGGAGVDAAVGGWLGTQHGPSPGATVHRGVLTSGPGMG